MKKPTPKTAPAKTPTTCLRCGATTKLSLQLDNLETLVCPDCNGTFRVADVEERIAELTALLSVVKSISTPNA
jgi:DNA-directed RNA polymerase subunit RPC12/RpoP